MLMVMMMRRILIKYTVFEMIGWVTFIRCVPRYVDEQFLGFEVVGLWLYLRISLLVELLVLLTDIASTYSSYTSDLCCA